MPKDKDNKRKRKKSNCWLFYTKTEKGGACKLCQKEIISNGNTTNLLNHLKRKHTIQWESTVDITDADRGPSSVEYIDDSDSDEEVEEDEEKESTELHRSPRSGPKDTQQTHGLAYQSADGRTVIWLHPDVQMEQLSAAGYQPQITLLGQTSEDTEKDLGMAEEIIQTSEDNATLSSEEALKAEGANSGESLHISEPFIVDSESQKDEAILSSSGEVCQIVTVVTATEEFKEKSAVGSVPKVSYVGTSPSTITVSSPQKVVVSHASSSRKSKKLRPKKKCKHSLDNDDSIQSKSSRSAVHHKTDSIQSKPSRSTVHHKADSIQSKPSRSALHHKPDSQVEASTCIPRKCCELQREDSFDHFGKYIATLLRNLPSRRSACKLQKEMINWVLKEQMLFED